MNLISKETIDRIKRENSIVDVAQRLGLFDSNSSKKVGRPTVAIKCIFHQEKTASLTLFTDSQRYKCFGCTETGDVLNLVQKRLNLSFSQALKWLDPTLEINPEINFDEAKQYVKDHGINDESFSKFDLCYTKRWIDHKPYASIKFNTPGGYKSRIFGLEAGNKYRFLPGGYHSLYKTGGDSKIAIITEGEFDAIRTYQETKYSCFSPTGGATDFKDKYVSEFVNFDLIVVAYDNDPRGKDGARATMQILKKQIYYKQIIQIEVPELLGKDWCDYFSAGMTKADFDELIENSKTYLFMESIK